MRRRITVAIVAVTALAVALFGVPLALVIHRLYVTDARAQLEREATLAARELPDDVDAIAHLAVLPAVPGGIALGVYAPGGNRLVGVGPAADDDAARAADTDRIVDRERDDRLVAWVPVAAAERVVAVVRAETSIHAAEHRAHLAWVLMAALGGGIVVLAGTLALVQANRLVRPLRRVRDSAGRLGHGDFTIAVPPTGVAELDDLAEALTTTAQRLGVAMAREQAFSAHASHQLRTPVTGLRVTLESELAAPRPDPSVALHEALAIADRLERTVDDLLRLARRPGGSERLNVARLLEQTEAHWRGPVAAAGRRLQVADAPVATPVVMASAAAVGQALDVLVDNALRHGAGTVSVGVTRVDGALALRVGDEGPGPGRATGPLPRHDGAAADPADGAPGRGHGIGLELATTLVEAEGGRLRPPGPGERSTFEILLPLAAG